MYRDAYLETEILSASPIRLVELLYRGAIEAVRSARAAVDLQQIAERNHQITKAQAILGELALSLDHDRGGIISRELVELYDYMQRRLNEANALQVGQPIDEVQKLLETLLEGWVTLAAGASSVLVIDGSLAASNPAPIHLTANQSPGHFLGVDLEGAGIDSLG